MASLSFRDRFFSPPVARALTSPSGILATGAGAAVGVVATIPLSLPLAVAGAVAGGAVGLGARLLAAMPRKGTGPRIDPFAVEEPWRAAILDAVRARARFSQALRLFRSGPMQVTLAGIDRRVEDAVQECWGIAQQGQLLSEARAAIDDRQVQRELDAARRAADGGGEDRHDRVVDALEAQLAAGGRLDALVADTRGRLTVLNAQLDQAVTEAIELSASNRTAGLVPLGQAVDTIVDDLEALRAAMADVANADAPGPAPSSEAS